MLPFDWLGSLAAGGAEGQLLLALAVFAATTTLIAFGVPGILIPMALGSGALIGLEAGIAVTLGAVAGSQLLFAAARRLGRESVARRSGGRLLDFERRFASHGILYLILLRVIGTPHMLVTGASALMPIKASHFAVATLIGSLPAIALAAATGAAI